MWNTTCLPLMILPLAFALCACDNGTTDTALACEDLDRVDYSESAELTPEQRRGVDDYLAMAGRYSAVYECMNTDPVDVIVDIRNVSSMNIELYVFPEDREIGCEELGTTSCEMTVENSGDPDLEGHDFFMSGEFPVNGNDAAEDWARISVRVQSDAFASAWDGIAQYRMRLYTDYTGELTGTKNVITDAVTLSSGTVTVTQRDECTLRGFSLITTP